MRRIFPYLVCLAGWLGGLPAWVPARGADVPEESVTINYPNSPASDILSFYEKLTGKVLVRDANLAGALLNIVATQPLPKSQAINCRMMLLPLLPWLATLGLVVSQTYREFLLGMI